MHNAESPLDAFPATQSEHVLSVDVVHFVAIIFPAEQNVQVVQDAAAAAEYFPLAQSVQDAAPPFENLPASQPRQSNLAGSENRPGEHGVHKFWAPFDTVPSGHAVQHDLKDDDGSQSSLEGYCSSNLLITPEAEEGQVAVEAEFNLPKNPGLQPFITIEPVSA